MSAWATAIVRARDGKILDVELCTSETVARAEVARFNGSTNRPAWMTMAVIAIDPEPQGSGS